MSVETTPAIERAAEANYLTRAGFRDDAREMYRASGEAVLQSWADATRPVVDAALDVEEMARAVLPYVGTFEGLAPVEQEFRRGIACNIRRAILGADS